MHISLLKEKHQATLIYYQDCKVDVQQLVEKKLKDSLPIDEFLRV